MKVHYINILLFALPLNILAYNQRNHKSTTHHTTKIPTTRLLFECDLYMPNYDNDPQMKKVMENFDKQTQQRFEEYDERIQSKRKQCKDKCDKEIQKIILKDKLEKELMDKFATLQTDIQSDDIPTCVCEKSLVDKMEKGCLRCGYGLGTVAPTVGLIGSVAVDQLTSVLTASAMEYATKKGIEEGVKAVIEKIIGGDSIFGIALQDVDLSNFITGSNYKSIPGLVKAVTNAINSTGKSCTSNPSSNPACSSLSVDQPLFVKAAKAGQEATAAKTTSLKATNAALVEESSANLYGAIGYSVLAILIIVLIMVIIYLILRYRRKKKMKKKAQYTKLLNEF
ncbi:rifin [Plasmodium reichenowi]|uniref:Rifin n=1 Tax=Plasmodium reichenowi TaxID=5854 RepID=A0A060RM85_PLARE|nr:rifin [Plasmodium reichenowi]